MQSVAARRSRIPALEGGHDLGEFVIEAVQRLLPDRAGDASIKRRRDGPLRCRPGCRSPLPATRPGGRRSRSPRISGKRRGSGGRCPGTMSRRRGRAGRRPGRTKGRTGTAARPPRGSPTWPPPSVRKIAAAVACAPLTPSGWLCVTLAVSFAPCRTSASVSNARAKGPTRIAEPFPQLLYGPDSSDSAHLLKSPPKPAPG